MMEFVNGKDDIPYMKWKIIQMFDTANQFSPSIKKGHIPAAIDSQASPLVSDLWSGSGPDMGSLPPASSEMGAYARQVTSRVGCCGFSHVYMPLSSSERELAELKSSTFVQWIGSREILQESPIVHGKIYCFL